MAEALSIAPGVSYMDSYAYDLISNGADFYTIGEVYNSTSTTVAINSGHTTWYVIGYTRNAAQYHSGGNPLQCFMKTGNSISVTCAYATGSACTLTINDSTITMALSNNSYCGYMNMLVTCIAIN